MNMSFEDFRDASKLWEQGEPERAERTAFYALKGLGIETFSLSDLEDWYAQLGLPKPNRTRLGKKIRQSGRIIKANGQGSFRLHPKSIQDLETEYSDLDNGSALRKAHRFIDPKRLDEIRRLTTHSFDFARLIRLCEELDHNFVSQNYYATGMLLRSVLDHVPPVFGCKTFSEVANNYGTRSFRELMAYLENASRKLSDSYLHTQIRKKEKLPTATQVNFSQPFDALLEEIVRINS